MLAGYDKIIEQQLKGYLRASLSQSLGGAVRGQSLLVSRLFCLQRAFLHRSCGAAAGSGGPGQPLLQPPRICDGHGGQPGVDRGLHPPLCTRSVCISSRLRDFAPRIFCPELRDYIIVQGVYIRNKRLIHFRTLRNRRSSVLLIFPIGIFFPPVVCAIYNISLTLCCASQFIRGNTRRGTGTWRTSSCLSGPSAGTCSLWSAGWTLLSILLADP